MRTAARSLNLLYLPKEEGKSGKCGHLIFTCSMGGVTSGSKARLCSVLI